MNSRMGLICVWTGLVYLDVVLLQQRQETGVIESGGIQDQRRFSLWV